MRKTYGIYLFANNSYTMKVAMLTEGREPIVGWWQLYAKFLSEYLVKDHHCTVDVFTRSIIADDGAVVDKDEVRDGGKIRVWRVGPAAKFFSTFHRLICLITTSWFLYKKAKKEKYDVIHAHALLAGIPAVIVGKLLNIPTVYTVHGSMHLDVNKKNLFYYAEKFLITRLRYDCEISVSSKVLNYPNRNKNIVIIRPGINTHRFHREKPEEKHSGTNFLFVGRLDWQKWLEFLIKAIANIDRKLLDEYHFHMNIVGDWGLRESLQDMIDKNNLKKYVVLLGAKTGEAVIQEFKKNHIFILPSLAEWQPIVIPEAFTCGMPVIGTDVGDVKDMVDETTWVLCEPGNVEQLQAAIEKLLTMSEAKRDELAANGYKKVLAEYTRESVSSAVYHEYKKLVSKKK